jgi:hypothetical protein
MGARHVDLAPQAADAVLVRAHQVARGRMDHHAVLTSFLV